MNDAQTNSTEGFPIPPNNRRYQSVQRSPCSIQKVHFAAHFIQINSQPRASITYTNRLQVAGTYSPSKLDNSNNQRAQEFRANLRASHREGDQQQQHTRNFSIA